jgi:5,10-methenyltetrahydrofolate synthetase
MNDIVPTNVDKRALRAQLLAKRQTMSTLDKMRFDDAICQGVRRLINNFGEHDSVIALYSPIRGEPDVQPLAEQLLSEGFSVVLPVVVGRDMPLKFAQYTRTDSLVVSSLGILEPDLDVLNPLIPDVVVIPCVGFDKHSHRLGYGGGFYDRTLATWKQKGHEPLTIGVAYDEALVMFEVGVFDVPMNEVVTPTNHA